MTQVSDAFKREINWPVTLWRWTWHITVKTVLMLALGCFFVDAFIAVYALGYGWSSLGPVEGISVSAAEFGEAMRYLLYVKATVGMMVTVVSGFFIGWKAVETAYKGD